LFLFNEASGVIKSIRIAFDFVEDRRVGCPRYQRLIIMAKSILIELNRVHVIVFVSILVIILVCHLILKLFIIIKLWT